MIIEVQELRDSALECARRQMWNQVRKWTLGLAIVLGILAWLWAVLG